MNKLGNLLFIVVCLIFFKNITHNYIKTRKKYKRLWKVDYVIIFFTALRATINEIWITLYNTTKKIYWYLNFKDIQYSRQEVINKIRNMTPREFEIFCANLYKELGYKVKLTNETCDGGKDLIIWDDNSNKYYVECKHYSENNSVGREIIQKLEGACFIDGVSNAILITTGNIHKNAMECKEKVDNLTLIDMDGIINMITRIQANKIPYILNPLI